ncbi:MAG: beta-lactamase family protein [Flavobacteriaceae bacterium]|nr:beta-lactamase family protein [Flavobacteriaceae bacterium]
MNLFFFSCKKSHPRSENETQTIDRTLPGFYDINFKTIFTQKENYSPNDSAIVSQLNDYYTHVWEAQKLSGGILIARGNHVLFEKYTGYANIETKTPVTPTTPIHVASVTKILTSLAILKLIEADKLSLNQKVSSLFSDFPYPDITLQDLLTHRSGLPNYAYVVEKIKSWDRSKKMTNDDVLNLFISHKPELLFQRDTRFSYSNTNFTLLALIVEKITGESFPNALDKMIFKPLGMNHSYIFQEKDLPNATLSYYANGKPYGFDYLALVYGDKNLYTTPEDLFKLSQAMYALNFLRKDLLEKMFTPYSNEKQGIKNYGLGMRIMVLKNGKKIIYHTGWWNGNNAIFISLPDEKITLIALGNKYSRAVYSVIRLTSLFGDYPLYKEEINHNGGNSTTTSTKKKPKSKPDRTKFFH